MLFLCFLTFYFYSDMYYLLVSEDLFSAYLDVFILWIKFNYFVINKFYPLFKMCTMLL